MGKSAPSPPPAPDPRVAANAQTAGNVATAQANTIMGNANERTPLGNVNYNVIGRETVFNPDSGQSYEIPRYERVETLSPEQQRLFDQQTRLGQDLNDLAINQTSRISGLIGEPISLDGLPNAPSDMSAYRSQVEQAMLERMNPQLDRDRTALETQLVNQGLQRGSEAFNRSLDEARRQANDARTGIFLASGDESRREAEQQAIARERALQERLVPRNQSINEITSLMSGGQVTMPQFTPFRGAQMSEVPIADMMYRSAEMERQNWMASQQMNAQSRAGMFGALGNIGAGLFRFSDRRLKRDIRAMGIGAHGLTVYAFRYAWDDAEHVGYMADEVRAVRPDAVATVAGFDAVNYGALHGDD